MNVEPPEKTSIFEVLVYSYRGIQWEVTMNFASREEAKDYVDYLHESKEYSYRDLKIVELEM